MHLSGGLGAWGPLQISSWGYAPQTTPFPEKIDTRMQPPYAFERGAGAWGPFQMSNYALCSLYTRWEPTLSTCRQLRARRALLQSKDVPLRTRRAPSLYKVYGDNALLVLNRTSLNCNNALLAPNWRYGKTAYWKGIRDLHGTASLLATFSLITHVCLYNLTLILGTALWLWLRHIYILVEIM